MRRLKNTDAAISGMRGELSQPRCRLRLSHRPPRRLPDRVPDLLAVVSARCGLCCSQNSSSNHRLDFCFPCPCLVHSAYAFVISRTIFFLLRRIMSTSSASPAPTSNSTPSNTSQQNVVPSEVGWQFVPQYYTFVNKQPNRLHCFYTKNSTFIHGTEGEDGRPCYGQQVCRA